MAKVSEASVEYAADVETPEDRKARREAERDAANWIGPFWRANWRRFVAIIQTYEDGKAEDLFERLREDFWGRTQAKKGPPPKGAR